MVLEYIPGCDRPVGIDFVIDGHCRSENVLTLLGHPTIDNRGVWERFVKADIELADLARWGHQVPRLPWEDVDP